MRRGSAVEEVLAPLAVGELLQTSRPVPSAWVKPSIPWPAATSRPSRRRGRPMNGMLLGVRGRKPATRR